MCLFFTHIENLFIKAIFSIHFLYRQKPSTVYMKEYPRADSLKHIPASAPTVYLNLSCPVWESWSFISVCGRHRQPPGTKLLPQQQCP